MALDPDTLAQRYRSSAKFVDERLIPLEDQVAAEDKIPDTVIAEMAELGLFGLTIPVEYRRAGAQYRGRVQDSDGAWARGAGVPFCNWHQQWHRQPRSCIAWN